MNADLSTALVGLVTALVGGGLAYLATRATTRQANKAANDQTALDGWRSLARQYEKDKQGVQSQLGVLETNLADLNRKVKRLEEERDEHRRWRRLVLVYVRQLREYIAGIPGHHPPAPPEGLSLTELSDG